jgi:hypothetical protein
LTVHPQIDVMSGARSWRFSLEADRTTIGTAAENAVDNNIDPDLAVEVFVLEPLPRAQ